MPTSRFETRMKFSTFDIVESFDLLFCSHNTTANTIVKMLQHPRRRHKGPTSSCGQCGKSPCRHKCQKCMAIYYCDKKCQKLHWQSHHKAECSINKQADPSSIIRSYARGANEEHNGESHHDALPNTLPTAQRSWSRNQGNNQGKKLWTMLAKQVISWSYVLYALKTTCVDLDDELLSCFILTVPPSEVLFGSGVKFWSLCLIYHKISDSYHMMFSDHLSGIHNRMSYICCNAEFEIAPTGKKKFFGEPVMDKFHKSDPIHVRVEWFTGDISEQGNFGQLSAAFVSI